MRSARRFVIPKPFIVVALKPLIVVTLHRLFLLSLSRASAVPPAWVVDDVIRRAPVADVVPAPHNPTVPFFCTAPVVSALAASRTTGLAVLSGGPRLPATSQNQQRGDREPRSVRKSMCSALHKHRCLSHSGLVRCRSIIRAAAGADATKSDSRWSAPRRGLSADR